MFSIHFIKWTLSTIDGHKYTHINEVTGTFRNEDVLVDCRYWNEK